MVSTPAIADDGTIYVGSEDTNLYAVNPDGTQKWEYPLGDENKYSPGINPTVKGVNDPYDDDVVPDYDDTLTITFDMATNMPPVAVAAQLSGFRSSVLSPKAKT